MEWWVGGSYRGEVGRVIQGWGGSCSVLLHNNNLTFIVLRTKI